MTLKEDTKNAGKSVADIKSKISDAIVVNYKGQDVQNMTADKKKLPMINEKYILFRYLQLIRICKIFAA